LARKRLGYQTVWLETPPVIRASAAVGGAWEGRGPAGKDFDLVYQDLILGQDSFEKAERMMLLDACHLALEKAGVAGPPPKVDYFLAGDLLNQIVTTSFSALSLSIPFLGLYGACATFCEALSVGSTLIDGGFADTVLCGAASHNATAERQYRYPTEYGGQRKPYAQTTVTAAGTIVLQSGGEGPRITHVTTGKVVDLGIKDPYNQGAAMAPAAVDTIAVHLSDTGRSADYYDLILTGDLAAFGREMAIKLALERQIVLGKQYRDCGAMIFSDDQNVGAGGSGAGCVAAMTAGYWLSEMARGKYRRMLVVATGALLSPTTFQQGENIPAVAHAVAIEV